MVKALPKRVTVKAQAGGYVLRGPAGYTWENGFVDLFYEQESMVRYWLSYFGYQHVGKSSALIGMYAKK